MNTLALTLSFLFAVVKISTAAEWYENLAPGISRNEIIEIAGEPTSKSKSSDKYVLLQGHLEIKYRDGVLSDCTHYNPGEGAVSQSLYSSWGGNLTADHTKERQAYLEKGNYLVLPRFKGPQIRTFRYDGICYELRDGFLVVEPIIQLMGGSGYFHDKTAKITQIDSAGNPKILYQASSDWKKLKPPKIQSEQIELRTNKLYRLGKDCIEKPLDEVFGREDSRMGSGMDYRLFYLEDGLAFVAVFGDTGAKNSAKIMFIGIDRPGSKSISLDCLLYTSPSPRD